MSRTARFVLGLIAVLGALSLLAYVLLISTTRRWFERDVRLRSLLAIQSAQQSLAAKWHTRDREGLASVLSDITRDERIMGAATCGADGVIVVTTDDYPEAASCASLFARARTQGFEEDGLFVESLSLPGGPVQATLALRDDGGTPFAVVLLHDLAFVDRREATTRTFVLLGAFILAVGASVLTLLSARIARTRWLSDLQRALRGEAVHELTPLLGDLRAQVTLLEQERQIDVRLTRWTPDRLRAALAQHLEGERIVVVANREPYIHEREGDTIRVVHPASGLVTALEPVMRACSGTWVAHGAGSADRATVDAHDRVKVPPGEEAYVLRRVWLTEEEEAGYYYGLSNEGLWPLCHVAHARPTFRSSDWEQYRRVNRKFADAVCDEADVDDPIILVQDYHFALAPRMIRERLPRATILTFWHIPWPSAERFGICPWRGEILEGLLGSSIVGFHTRQHCNNFLEGVDTFLEARIDRERDAVVQAGRATLVRPYPISIEWPVHWLDDLPSIEACRAHVLAELGLAPDTLLGVGVDRLDYTKGVEERLLAVDELLRRFPEYRGKFTFAQLAAPSRTRIERYRDLNDRIEALTHEINARWGTDAYKPIVLYRAHHEPKAVFRYYRAANLCYVSSLHDGMNLVAKEFVAARDDERGVLLLSQFTGAARELTEALIVNPYDLHQASDALAAALSMPPGDQRERMHAMRARVADFNVYRWAGRMIVDAAELRRGDRLTGRLVPVRHGAVRA